MKIRGDQRDEEICRLLEADTGRGMELLFRVYYKRLVVWADTFLRDMQAAEDVVQEFFIALWEKKRVAGLRGSTLAAFLCVSVRNRCLHRLEKRDVFRHAVDLSEVEIPFEEYNERRDQLISRVLHEIDLLSPRSREVMMGVFVEGLKYREVAERYDISVSTVKTLLGNAVQRLRERLESDGFAAFLLFFGIKK